MNQLPPGWAETTIGEINFRKSRNIKPSDFPTEVFELYSVPVFPDGKPEHTRGENIGSSKQVVSEGDILLCKINPRINRVWIVAAEQNERQIASSEWIVINNNLLSSDYIRYAFTNQAFRDVLCSEVTGVGGSLTRAQPKKVSTYKFALAPLNEQIRIANKLDSLLAKVETAQSRLEKIPTLLKRFRQSVLAAATSGELTKDWREISHSWDVVSYAVSGIVKSEKYSLGIGPFGSNLKVVDYRNDGHPLVFVREIRANCFGGHGTKFVDDDKFEELAAHRVKPGNLLVTKMGDPPGDVAIYPETRPEAVITSDCIKLDVDEETAVRNFVYFYMQAPVFQKQIQKITAGVAQQKVNLKKFRTLIVELPSLEEQVEIVRRVESLFAKADAVEAQYQAAKQRLDKLTRSTLVKAFRGELVPQNPNDEPASELLKRIQAEREKQAKK